MESSYIPLSEKEQQSKANRIAAKQCPHCIHDYPKCRKCLFYYVLNEMVGEQLTLEEIKEIEGYKD